jgi:hypothetical protein
MQRPAQPGARVCATITRSINAVHAKARDVAQDVSLVYRLFVSPVTSARRKRVWRNHYAHMLRRIVC